MEPPRRLGSVNSGLDDLLRVTGCADIEELSSAVDEDADVDIWVEACPGGVRVSTGAAAIDLPYPFTLADFREVLDELETDYLRRCSPADDT